MHLALSLRSGPVLRVLATLVAGFAVAHAAVVTLRLRYGYHDLFGARRMFELNEEQNLPTFFSALLLLAAAALLAVHGAAARRRPGAPAAAARPWWGLAALFVFLSVDEAAGIHELLNDPLRKGFGASGALYFAWVAPYVVLGAAVALAYGRFLLRLPRGIALRIVGAGAVYVGGAAGVELLEAVLFARNGGDYWSLSMEVAYLAEEVLEMLGVAWFIAALLRLIELEGRPLRLAVGLPTVGAATGRTAGAVRAGPGAPSWAPARAGQRRTASGSAQPGVSGNTAA